MRLNNKTQIISAGGIGGGEHPKRAEMEGGNTRKGRKWNPPNVPKGGIWGGNGRNCGGSNTPYPLRITSANAESKRLAWYGRNAGMVERGVGDPMVRWGE